MRAPSRLFAPVTSLILTPAVLGLIRLGINMSRAAWFVTAGITYVGITVILIIIQNSSRSHTARQMGPHPLGIDPEEENRKHEAAADVQDALK